MITIEHDRDDFLVCHASGKLTGPDYDAMIPELENALQLRRGEVRMMIVLEDFRGWSLEALWEDIKFDIRHRNDFSRIAVVGRSRVAEWGTRLSKPLFGAQVRFYDMEDRDMARAWLSEGGSGQPARAGETERAD